MWFADESGFYFSTTTTKRLCKQLKAKPKVEVCFYAPPQGPLGHEGSTDIGTMMRVSGEVIFLEEGSLKQRLLNDRPFLRPSADIQVIFRVQKGEARFWKSEDSGRESTIDTAHF
jgi:pyridoxamine 5'-phosphate oxidase